MKSLGIMPDFFLWLSFMISLNYPMGLMDQARPSVWMDHFLKLYVLGEEVEMDPIFSSVLLYQHKPYESPSFLDLFQATTVNLEIYPYLEFL